MATQMDFDDFVTAYIACAIWCGVMVEKDGELESADGDYLNLDSCDLSPEALATINKDCEDFFEANYHHLLATTRSGEDCGHDFYLTRNGHGAGFWDRKHISLEADKALDILTAACKPYGEQTLIASTTDDGNTYTISIL